VGRRDLPDASGKKIVECLVRHFHFRVARRSKKGHFILERDLDPNNDSIPDHPKVKKDLLADQLDLAGIDHREFASLCR
jgi:hypothetical protein